jgi:hypothetical protein
MQHTVATDYFNVPVDPIALDIPVREGARPALHT